MEGIETTPRSLEGFPVQVSVGAPTWRGLKQTIYSTPSWGAGSISRCPDMEGIETSDMRWRRGQTLVSVGAPTWRGLKPPDVVR